MRGIRRENSRPGVGAIRTQSRNPERGVKVGFLDTAHQEKEKNEGTKKSRKKRKQATDFEEAVCCPSAFVQGAA